MKRFLVTPSTALERNRVREHGNIWDESKSLHIPQGSKKLLRSIKTNHERWWSNDCLQELQA